MEDITIRVAVKEDCHRLLELIQELALYEKAPDEVTVTLDHFVESGFGVNPVWKAFVAASPSASEGGEVIHGFALYYIRYSTWKGQRMYLEDLLVTESMRCKGVGKMLFDRLIEEAKEKGFNGIVWQVLDWNEPAISFYKKYNASFDGGWINCSIELKS
jgi:GNAT superfamily N-acetyltransferase